MIRQLTQLYRLFDGGTRLRIVMLLCFMGLAIALEMAGLGLILPIVELLSNPGAPARFSFLADIQRRLGMEGSTRLVVMCLGLLGVFYIAKNGILLLVAHAQNWFILHVTASFMDRLLRFYLAQPYSYHLRRNSAELYRNVHDSTQTVLSSGLLPVLTLIMESATILGITAVLFLIEPVGTLVVAGSVGGTAVVFYLLMHRWAQRLGAAVENTNGAIVRWVMQSFSSVKEAKVLGRESFFANKVLQHGQRRARARSLMSTINQSPRMLMESLGAVGLILISLSVLWRGNRIEDLLPVLSVFAVAAFRLLPSATRITASAIQFREAGPALDNIFDDVLAARRGENSSPPTCAPIQFAGSLSVRAVSFSYPGTDRRALNDVTIEILKGQATAFVGISGSGKSTLIDVILGLITPDSGAVLVDGRPIAADVAAWQRLVGYVPQQVTLIDDTLRRNIAFGIPDGEIRDADMERALRIAGLDDVVARMPQGLDTELGERGVRISGGQRQRVGIARAVYHHPQVLVLDEPTAALDPETETRITAALELLRKEVTVLTIAHRLKTVQTSDKIFFMQEGHIAAEGSFASLLASVPDFRRFVELAELKIAPLANNNATTISHMAKLPT